MIDWREQLERIDARGAEYRAGLISESVFAAALHAMRLRGDDVRHKMAEFAPPAPTGPTFQQARIEASRQWLKEYLK